jgi:hypothetical protein
MNFVFDRASPVHKAGVLWQVVLFDDLSLLVTPGFADKNNNG